MKALIVNKDGLLEIRDLAEPKITEKQALVKTISCGICNGTDAKIIHHNFKGINVSEYPLMLGHEGVGEVVRIGKKVTGYHIGDKVLLPFVNADQELYGELRSAWGAFCEYAVVDDLQAYDVGKAPECAYAQAVLPDYVDPVDGAVIVTLREVLSAIKRFGIKKDQSVAVFGCGPVGLIFIRFMQLLGVHPIIAFDIKEEKIKEVLKNGADFAFCSRQINPEREIKRICPEGVEFVLDAVGMTSLINQAMSYISDEGKICCYGIAPECNMKIDWEKAPYNWQLQFQQFPSKKEEGETTAQILEWIQKGEIRLKDYISDYFMEDQILEAFEKLERREISKKGIVVYH